MFFVCRVIKKVFLNLTDIEWGKYETYAKDFVKGLDDYIAVRAYLFGGGYLLQGEIESCSMLQKVDRRSLHLFKEEFWSVSGGPRGRRNFVSGFSEMGLVFE